MAKQNDSIISDVETVVSEVQKGVENQLQPLRKSIIKRFPTLFLLAVTFGVSLVFYSIEVILGSSVFLNEYPWLTLGIGILLLAITGTLYRKLE